jgi:hypothetical protein
MWICCIKQVIERREDAAEFGHGILEQIDESDLVLLVPAVLLNSQTIQIAFSGTSNRIGTSSNGTGNSKVV